MVIHHIVLLFRQTCNDILELMQTQSMGVQGKTKREGKNDRNKGGQVYVISYVQ